MKKAIAAFLCIMLTTGMISGCAEREPESEAAQENTGAEESQETQDSQEEPEESQEETAEKEENAQVAESTGEEDQEAGDQEDSQDRDMTEDLTMSVLKDQAGTVDYTSLEELTPEAGSRIAVVLKSTSRDEFWTTVRDGIEDAVKALNEKMGYTGEDQITVSFDGPTDDSDVEKQIDLIDTVLSENPTIICIAAIDRQSCEAQLEMAAENDIPVVMLDSGVESGPISALCATDNYAAGTEAAKKMAEAIGDEGQIAVMTHTESAQTSQDREKGFTDEISKNHPNIEIVNISHENDDFTMEKMAADAVFTLYPEVEGYFCTNEDASGAVLDALDAAGKEITVIGFDSGEQQQNAVKNGTELGFFAQNPYGMGYAAVIAGVRADQNLEVDTFINTSYQWIDSSNLENEEYSSYLYG